MAGTLKMLWFVTLFSGAISIAINGNECESDRGIILKCTWKGEGPYIVNGIIKEEILTITKLTNAVTLFVPDKFAGNLAKIEVLKGDIPCRNIIAPLHIAVFVNNRRCMVDFTTMKATPSTVTLTMDPSRSPATSTTTVTPTVTTVTSSTAAAMPSTVTVTSTSTTAQRPSLDDEPWEITVYVLTAVIVLLIILFIIITYGVRKFRRRQLRQFRLHDLPMQELPKDHSA